MLVMPADITDQKRHDLHDVIMYCFSLASIENNRGNYILNQDMLKDMSRFADVESAIGRALEEHRMEFHLQPIVDSISGRTIGAEALARLNDPDLGFIPPNEFIMVAEKTGDIMEMGRQLFNKICEFLADTDIKKYGLRNINVNLSPVQCMNSKLASELSGIADRHNVSLDLIDFEITETAIEDNDQIHDQIVRLQNKGALISLDDFGMGTSNLTRLMQFPIHVVKLDLNVVRSFFNGESSVLPDLIRMFHNSGMKVVAEGVETEEMKDGLMQMGCEYEQGYYFSKPVPPNEFIEYLEREA
jgi:EAL domain-containing protein (putative c-di-GMP-specific phosphodiesterase class I)